MASEDDILKIFEPRRSRKPIETVSALASWMSSECANKTSYGIGWDISEGMRIDRFGATWRWQYTERSEVRTIKTFESESEIAACAYEQIRKDPWAWTHCVGWFKFECHKKAYTETLEDRGIAFYQDQIPFGGPEDPRYRIFVFGRDVLELKKVNSIYGN
ncbi:MAG: hypothetical protein ABJP02_13805 [Parasphingorhabdus sp.]|uniref:hypothetical protein n=1 Tax=Parasphingorhabdus sp. TaxID=2709688 RepID=UPI003297814D